MIEIMPPQTSWVGDFRSLRSTLLRAAPADASIHHIGSTAIPGLPAKDIIDIQISVDSLVEVDRAAFEREGFLAKYGLVDHCPPSIQLDEAELMKLFFKSQGRPANVHIRQRGRFNQRFALVTRDFLRTHPVAAAAYGLVKQRLALRFRTDEDAYYEIKDPVFDIIYAGAEAWAERVGWTEPPGD